MKKTRGQKSRATVPLIQILNHTQYTQINRLLTFSIHESHSQNFLKTFYLKKYTLVLKKIPEVRIKLEKMIK
jgi:hypothetical protein